MVILNIINNEMLWFFFHLFLFGLNAWNVVDAQKTNKRIGKSEVKDAELDKEIEQQYAKQKQWIIDNPDAEQWRIDAVKQTIKMTEDCFYEEVP